MSNSAPHSRNWTAALVAVLVLAYRGPGCWRITGWVGAVVLEKASYHAVKEKLQASQEAGVGYG